MDDALRAIAAERGVFLTREALELGFDGKAIARAVRGRLWHRVRRGAFVPYDVWTDARPEQRHLILAAAVHRSYRDRVAFSHVTAALIHGLAVWGVDLSRVHVTRLDGGAGRTEPDIVHHEAQCLSPGDVVSSAGWLVTAPARAALETGILTSTESSLVTLDSLLHLGMGDLTELGNQYDVITHWPGTQHLQIAVRMADACAESPGETRTRWMFFVQGIPAPELQFQVWAAGRLIGIADFCWRRHRMLGEFDGMRKYLRPFHDGQNVEDVVIAEKRREDRLRRTTGYGMFRLTWADLDAPRRTASDLRQMLTSAA